MYGVVLLMALSEGGAVPLYANSLAGTGPGNSHQLYRHRRHACCGCSGGYAAGVCGPKFVPFPYDVPCIGCKAHYGPYAGGLGAGQGYWGSGGYGGGMFPLHVQCIGCYGHVPPSSASGYGGTMYPLSVPCIGCYGHVPPNTTGMYPGDGYGGSSGYSYGSWNGSSSGYPGGLMTPPEDAESEGRLTSPPAEQSPRDGEGSGTRSREESEREEVSGPAPALLTVTLPAEATLTIDDAPTRSTAATRWFISPALPPGRDFPYTLQGKLVRDGRAIRVSRRVLLRAGKETRVALDFPAAGGARE